MSEFVRVCRLSEIPVGGMKGVKARGKEILVANIDGQAYAIGDICGELTTLGPDDDEQVIEIGDIAIDLFRHAVTRAGREVWKQALELAVVSEKKTLEVLSPREKVELNALLRKVVRGLQR